ncbi:hypothetical protein [Roseobacter weihaiensis]|nr:hypothetical protein [Roseobacter sp. H9]
MAKDAKIPPYQEVFSDLAVKSTFFGTGLGRLIIGFLLMIPAILEFT